MVKSMEKNTRKLQSKIDSLRNLTTQNGCTNEESRTARTLLCKLQIKLNLEQKNRALASYVAAIHYTPSEADQILREIRKQAQDRARQGAEHPDTWARIKSWITSKSARPQRSNTCIDSLTLDLITFLFRPFQIGCVNRRSGCSDQAAAAFPRGWLDR